MALKSAKIYDNANAFATAICGIAISSVFENHYIPNNNLRSLPVGVSYVFQ